MNDSKSTQNIEFTKKVYGEKQFQYANRVELLPSGFINYHKKNFATFFNMSENDFVGKKVLDTGCGPGKHAAVLALMGSDVTALDLSELNIEKAIQLKEGLNLKNLNFATFDLMQPLSNVNEFDLVSAHNWMQHSENPSQVMGNLVRATKRGGRLYFSLYQAGTFRFIIAQIARSILKPKDYEMCESIVGFHFPQGFISFGNYLDIYMENIFDDFFVPYCITTTYESLVRDAAKMGCVPVSAIPKNMTHYDKDNLALRVGFEKKDEVNFEGENFEFVKPVDEFSNESYPVQQIKEIAEKCIEKFKHNVTDVEKCAFCIGLYRIRAEVNSFTSEEPRFSALKFYLEQSLDSENWKISGASHSFQGIAKDSKPDMITPIPVQGN